VSEASLQKQIDKKDAEIALLRQQLQHDVQQLKQLVQVTSRLNSTLSLKELITELVTAATGLLGAEASSILLIDEQSGELKFEASSGDGNQGKQLTSQRVPANQGIAGWVVQNGQPLVVDDPSKDPRFYDQIDKAVGSSTRNILAVPLAVKDRVIGVAEVLNKRGGEGFSPADLELAQALASQASVAIDHARMFERMVEAMEAMRRAYEPR
jgi:sigma-B regulation protein RsbU (phosphoserine phosphatase)